MIQLGATNDVSLDVIALQLGANRNAMYKSAFDARHNLRKEMPRRDVASATEA